jgi:hypothetical protein
MIGKVLIDLLSSDSEDDRKHRLPEASAVASSCETSNAGWYRSLKNVKKQGLFRGFLKHVQETT